MLEDIRWHTPIPDSNDRAWMRARPLRALGRVAALAVVALVAGSLIAEAVNPVLGPATVAAVAVPIGGGK